jgi:hypothetical protein
MAVLGIVGILVESGQEFSEAQTEYSLFSVIAMLFDQAGFTGSAKDYVGLGSLSILLVCSVLLVPIMQIGTLLLQWALPMNRKTRYRLSIIGECLGAWQYAEVYLIAVLFASWQLGPVSDFMINEYCGSLKGTFQALVYHGILKEEDATCFLVSAKPETASYILAAAAVLLALLNSFVNNAVNQYFREKVASDKRSMMSLDALQDEGEPDDLRKNIQPPPVLFTDRFRWFLHRENVMLEKKRSSLVGNDGEGLEGSSTKPTFETADSGSLNGEARDLPALVASYDSSDSSEDSSIA